MLLRVGGLPKANKRALSTPTTWENVSAKLLPTQTVIDKSTLGIMKFWIIFPSKCNFFVKMQTL
jgi:hypothetical protein